MSKKRFLLVSLVAAVLALLVVVTASGQSGTPELVKDINSGAGGSSFQSITNVNGTLFFGATDGTTGEELWKSDGAEAGTVLVKDIKSEG